MLNQIKISIRIIALVTLISLSSKIALAEDLKGIVNLEGTWKFTIGDNPEWSNPNFDDSDWERIRVPSSWENEGFSNYNGYAWYRKQFEIERSVNYEFVYLVLGYIDDADEVYLNGKLIGSMGSMQTNPKTAYDIKRRYPIPVSLLNLSGKNTIAVRVYDFYDRGGIVNGIPGIFVDQQSRYLDLNLSGYWGFETEKEMKDRLKKGDAKNTNKIFVPAAWECQGYNNYDGKARYNLQFRVPDKLENQELYLILGFVDDAETVYLNKEKLGSVFSLEEELDTGLPYYIIFRGYKIPDNLLKTGAYNSLSVMVYDKGGLGGIYEGPVGIVTKENYKILKQLNTRKMGFWETFFTY